MQQTRLVAAAARLPAHPCRRSACPPSRLPSSRRQTRACKGTAGCGASALEQPRAAAAAFRGHAVLTAGISLPCSRPIALHACHSVRHPALSTSAAAAALSSLPPHRSKSRTTSTVGACLAAFRSMVCREMPSRAVLYSRVQRAWRNRAGTAADSARTASSSIKRLGSASSGSGCWPGSRGAGSVVVPWRRVAQHGGRQRQSCGLEQGCAGLATWVLRAGVAGAPRALPPGPPAPRYPSTPTPTTPAGLLLHARLMPGSLHRWPCE